MLEAKDQSWLGTAARLALWCEIDEKGTVGPVLYDEYPDEESKYRVQIGTLCRVLELLDRVCTPRLRELRQRLIEARREAYVAADWDKHAMCIQKLSFQDVMVRDEALSYVLFLLEIPFGTFQESFEFYVANKNGKTASEFATISKM